MICCTISPRAAPVESLSKYRIAARISAYNSSLDLTGAAAIVVETQAHYDTALRFANIGQAKRPIRVFFTPEEARAWLDTDPKYVDGV